VLCNYREKGSSSVEAVQNTIISTPGEFVSCAEEKVRKRGKISHKQKLPKKGLYNN